MTVVSFYNVCLLSLHSFPEITSEYVTFFLNMQTNEPRVVLLLYLPSHVHCAVLLSIFATLYFLDICFKMFRFTKFLFLLLTQFLY